MFVFNELQLFLLTNISSLDVAGCDVSLNVTDATQYIATEGYPESYKGDQNCQFNFEAPSGRKIIVMFEDFDLEEGFDFIHFRELHNSDTQM